MTRILSRPSLIVAVLVSALAGSLLAMPTAASAAPSAEDAIRRILADTNAVRAQAGKPPLARDSRMDAVAGAWSGRQAAQQKMYHNPDYAKQIPAGWRSAGENVAYGYQPDAVVAAWRNSEGHYRNMVGDYTHIGIGVAWTSSGRAYYTQNFARYPSGVPAAGVSPVGSLDSLTVDAASRTVTIGGWAADPDSSPTVRVHVYVDGKPASSVAADRSRPDVGAAHPKYGSSRGFAATFAGSTGSHRVCAYAINAGAAAANTTLGCRTYSLGSPQPFGSLDRVAANGFRTATVSGWAIDPDTANPIDVHLYVGSGGRAVRADLARADVGRAHPAFGAAHGFSAEVALRPGANRVCAYAINVGHGSGSTALGCRTITAPTGQPIGRVDRVALEGASARVSGWALDPDSTGSIRFHAYVNGRPAVSAVAAGDRPDVARAYPGYGAAHGISAAIPVPKGRSTVCLYAINTGPAAANPKLGCGVVTR
jgi:hypothetical protein